MNCSGESQKESPFACNMLALIPGREGIKPFIRMEFGI